MGLFHVFKIAQMVPNFAKHLIQQNRSLILRLLIVNVRETVFNDLVTRSFRPLNQPEGPVNSTPPVCNTVFQDSLITFFYFLDKVRAQEANLSRHIYLLKVNNRNTRTRCEICSKLTIKTPERRRQENIVTEPVFRGIFL